MEESRGYQRYSCNLPVKVLENVEIDGVALDIGFDGMLIFIDKNQDIHLNSTVQIRFRLPFMMYDTKVFGKVYWKDENTVGVSFLNFMEEDINGLRKFIELILDIEGQSEIQEIQSRIAINALLETTLSKLSLERQLKVAIEIILTTSWLGLEYKGAIFLFDHKEKVLTLKASVNIPKAQMLCKKVSIGQCLCGRVGELKTLVFSDFANTERTLACDDMKPYGHYCIPLLEEMELIGVLNLYVPTKYLRNESAESFFLAASKIIANLIKFRKTEENAV
ncbi:hypothetical protein CCP3SC1AL1_230023 [Gammaproteobacteria bacterium]